MFYRTGANAALALLGLTKTANMFLRPTPGSQTVRNLIPAATEAATALPGSLGGAVERGLIGGAMPKAVTPPLGEAVELMRNVPVQRMPSAPLPLRPVTGPAMPKGYPLHVAEFTEGAPKELQAAISDVNDVFAKAKPGLNPPGSVKDYTPENFPFEYEAYRQAKTKERLEQLGRSDTAYMPLPRSSQDITGAQPAAALAALAARPRP